VAEILLSGNNSASKSSMVLPKFETFAQNVPGFDDTILSLIDREILLRSACIEITVIFASQLFSIKPNLSIIKNMQFQALRCAYAESMKMLQNLDSLPKVINGNLLQYDPMGIGLISPFKSSVKKLAKSFRQLEVTEDEVALLSAICLMSSESFSFLDF